MDWSDAKADGVYLLTLELADASMNPIPLSPDPTLDAGRRWLGAIGGDPVHFELAADHRGGRPDRPIGVDDRVSALVGLRAHRHGGQRDRTAVHRQCELAASPSSVGQRRGLWGRDPDPGGDESARRAVVHRPAPTRRPRRTASAASTTCRPERPAGCYSFGLYADTRAFNSRAARRRTRCTPGGAGTSPDPPYTDVVITVAIV